MGSIFLPLHGMGHREEVGWAAFFCLHPYLLSWGEVRRAGNIFPINTAWGGGSEDSEHHLAASLQGEQLGYPGHASPGLSKLLAGPSHELCTGPAKQ